MQLVFRTTDISDAYIVRGLLESNNIQCIVKNDLTQSLSGEMAYSAAWPEVWIASADDAARADELISNREKPAEKPTDWVCPKCGEKIEGEFDACWKCGQVRDVSA